MGFGRIQSVAGLTDEQVRAGALFLAVHARDAEDGWNLLEACGLVPCKPGEPAKMRTEKGPVVNLPVRGQ